MIDKELEDIVSKELIKSEELWGYDAEHQMAHYLKRKFFDHPEIHVLNNLRFKCVTDDGDYAQIDHLIITPYCFIVVETKNWVGGMKYDEDGNCWYLSKEDDEWHTSKESPIFQAKRQSEALRRVVQNNKEILRKKFLFLQGGFQNYPVHFLVALYGESNVVKPEKSCKYDGMVLKAEVIPDKILEIYEKYKNSDTVKNFVKDALLKNDTLWILPEEDIKKTVSFLKEIHCPQIFYRKIELESVKCKCGGLLSFALNRETKKWEAICKACGLVKPFSFKCSKCKKPLKLFETGWPRKKLAFCKYCDEYRIVKE